MSPAVLVAYDPTCDVHVQTDASVVGLGACLYIALPADDTGRSEKRPVAFASKLLTPAERNYSTPEQEALATVWALEKFNQYLYGRPFTLHSDQSSLSKLMTTYGSKPTLGRRIQRWYERLRHYDYQLKHIAGKENVVADYFSRLGEGRPPASEPTLPDDNDDVIRISSLTDSTLTTEQLREATANDPVLRQVKTYMFSGWPPNTKAIKDPDVRHFWRFREELSEKNGLLYREERLIIAASWRDTILARLHTGHPGIVCTRHLYTDLYFWPNGSTECEQMCRECTACARAEKSSKTNQVPTGEYPVPDGPWQVLAMDITGPFWEAPHRHENVVVLMDYFSKFPEIMFTEKTTSTVIIRWLEEVFSVWGNPLEIITDNGPQFVSDEFEEFLAGRFIKHTTTPVYCPQRNGLVERFNRVIKNSAQIFDGCKGDFKRHIRETVTSFRTIAPQGSESPAVLARGWNMRTCADVRNSRLEAGGMAQPGETTVCGTVKSGQQLELQQQKFIAQRHAENRTYAKTRTTSQTPAYLQGK